MSNFGVILKSLRENANMTQEELAKALHISTSAVSSYEQDIRFPPSETLINIANIFHVSVDYLLGREQKRRVLYITGLKDEDVRYLCITISFLQAKNQANDAMPLT